MITRELNDGLILPSFEDVCERQAEWIDETWGLVDGLEAEIERLRADNATLKAAMRASFDEHGSAPTDCDCSKCTRLAVLLDYLPVDYLNVNDGQPS